MSPSATHAAERGVIADSFDARPRESQSSAPRLAGPANAQLLALRASVGRIARIAALASTRFAADHLPPAASRAVALAMGAMRSAISVQGAVNARIIQQFAGVGEREARSLARRYLTTLFLDFRFAQRIANGQDDPNLWTCEQRNFDLVRQLNESGRPYIVATGHFTRQAHAHLYTRASIPHRLSTIIAPLDGTSARYELFVAALKRIRPDMILIVKGDATGLKTLVRTLRTPGNVVKVMADAYLIADERSAIELPFLGAPRAFPVGTARLARMAQCPIAVCAPQLGEDGRPVMVWKKVIAPPEPRDDEADARVTREVVGLIEQAVIEHPDQYALPYRLGAI